MQLNIKESSEVVKSAILTAEALNTTCPNGVTESYPNCTKIKEKYIELLYQYMEMLKFVVNALNIRTYNERYKC